MSKIKEQFPEFFQSELKDSDLFSKSNNLIVLDTNFLLDVIRMPTKIARKYIETLKKVEDNIYIPYLVALEFNFKKSDIKKGRQAKIRNYKSNVEKSIKDLKNTIKNHELVTVEESKEEFSSKLIENTEKFEEKILAMLETEVSTSITKGETKIYNELIDIIENRIGDKYEQEWIDSVESEGKKRYEDKIPPGFDDIKKDNTSEQTRRYDGLTYETKFGDLIIWKDIIEHSKDTANKGSKVIFITDDGRATGKNDLLYKVHNLTVGPHISLMNELQTKAKKELYILANLWFVKRVSGLTDAEIKSLSTSKPSQEYLESVVNERFLNKLLSRYDNNIENTQSLESYLEDNAYKFGGIDKDFLKNYMHNAYDFDDADKEQLELMKKKINGTVPLYQLKMENIEYLKDIYKRQNKIQNMIYKDLMFDKENKIEDEDN